MTKNKNFIIIYIFNSNIYILVTFNFIIERNFDISFLNPIRNYGEWSMFNWFGIGMITLFLNIIFLPYSIIYWLVKLIYFLITVGREKD